MIFSNIIRAFRTKIASWILPSNLTQKEKSSLFSSKNTAYKESKKQLKKLKPAISALPKSNSQSKKSQAHDLDKYEVMSKIFLNSKEFRTIEKGKPAEEVSTSGINRALNKSRRELNKAIIKSENAIKRAEVKRINDKSKAINKELNEDIKNLTRKITKKLEPKIYKEATKLGIKLQQDLFGDVYKMKGKIYSTNIKGAENLFKGIAQIFSEYMDDDDLLLEQAFHLNRYGVDLEDVVIHMVNTKKMDPSELFYEGGIGGESVEFDLNYFKRMLRSEITDYLRTMVKRSDITKAEKNVAIKQIEEDYWDQLNGIENVKISEPYDDLGLSF